jgi:hypothetical protein
MPARTDRTVGRSVRRSFLTASFGLDMWASSHRANPCCTGDPGARQSMNLPSTCGPLVARRPPILPGAAAAAARGKKGWLSSSSLCGVSPVLPGVMVGWMLSAPPESSGLALRAGLRSRCKASSLACTAEPWRRLVGSLVRGDPVSQGWRSRILSESDQLKLETLSKSPMVSGCRSGVPVTVSS